ncbi:MAG: diaminopimelate epimerase [Lachnospiraceae bacterium]|nr:diaminopimelate epimerase [Lachnospiraceae bacterium]
MKFTKMHGCGNDYVYVNGAEEKVENKAEFAKFVSDRHFGIGADGAIFINTKDCATSWDDAADFEMEMYNADGSRGEMCGNGIRCVAKYVYDHGMTDKEEVNIISAGAVKPIKLTIENGKVVKARVNMGAPILKPSEIPVGIPGHENDESIVDVPIPVMDTTYRMTCVSMGNPHAVTFVPETDGLDLEEIGPYFEHHAYFPKRINTEFVKVVDRNHVKMRVWERGSGETLACGTGCCATVVSCVLNGLTENKVFVKVLGGELEIEWDREANLVYMTGPATTVFEGELDGAF